MPAPDDAASADALITLARRLAEADYRFTTVTPETQRRVLARRQGALASTWRDVFGWNLPFQPGALPANWLALLRAAGAVVPCSVEPARGALRCTLRFSTLRGLPYVHSAYPTQDSDAVFFGPDTLRFVDLIERVLAPKRPCARGWFPGARRLPRLKKR